MRKFSVVFAALMAAGLLSAGGASAEPSARCGGMPAAVGSNWVAVCAPAGKVEAGGGTSGGYVVADGDSTNPDPADGYIGVDSKSVIVCSDQGDYSFATSTQCNPAP